MKYNVQSDNGNPVTLSFHSGCLLDAWGYRLAKHKIISVCAWCDKDKLITKLLKNLGYEISHGMCEQCSENQLKGITDECKTMQEQSSGRAEQLQT